MERQRTPQRLDGRRRHRRSSRSASGSCSATSSERGGKTPSGRRSASPGRSRSSCSASCFYLGSSRGGGTRVGKSGTRLYRSRDDRMIGGVLGGVGDVLRDRSDDHAHPLRDLRRAHRRSGPAVLLYVDRDDRGTRGARRRGSRSRRRGRSLSLRPRRPTGTGSWSQRAGRTRAPRPCRRRPRPPRPAAGRRPRRATRASRGTDRKLRRAHGPRIPLRATAPGDVIDAHVHLFTVGLLEEFLDKDPNPNPRFREAAQEPPVRPAQRRACPT